MTPMPGKIRDVEHDVQRGEIIRALVPHLGRWMKLRTLQYALANINVPLSCEDLSFHLEYLCGAGLVEVQRAVLREDQPIPDDSAPGDISLVRITNKGLHLYDRKIAPDPGVKF